MCFKGSRIVVVVDVPPLMHGDGGCYIILDVSRYHTYRSVLSINNMSTEILQQRSLPPGVVRDRERETDLKYNVQKYKRNALSYVPIFH